MNTTPSTVLVLGARGRFGSAATQAFAEAGWRVLAQSRQPLPLPAGAQRIDTPLHDTRALVQAAVGACAVVHAVNPVYTRWDTELLPLARQGMDVAERLGARFLLPGNVYNFGESMPPLLQVDTPQRPSTSKGRQRCQLEDEMAARAARGLHGTVLRAGDFYGHGTGSWIDLLIAKALLGERPRGALQYPGPLDLPHAWAYLPDLARAMVALASRPTDRAAAFERFHFTGHTLTGAALLDHLEHAATALGVKPAGGFSRRTMAWWPLQVAGLVWPMGRELVRMSYLWRVPHALDGRALAGAVGVLPSTPVDVALRAALRDLGVGTGAPTPAALAA